MLKRVAVMLLAAVFCLPAFSYAYKTIKVENGGSITGTVQYSGKEIPKDVTYTLLSDTNICGKHARTEKYLINKDREVKNVAVYLSGIKAGKALPVKTVVILDAKCTYVPHVEIAFTGNKMKVENEDAILHTLHVYMYRPGRTIYNVALPWKGSSVTRTLTRTGVMELNCDCHPWMDGYVFVLDNPYAALTDENGEFTIENIPPGTYTVRAWHEALGDLTLSNVTVEGGKVTNIKLTYAGAPEKKSNDGLTSSH